MNDKLVIERYKTAKRDAKLSEPPHLFTSEEIADLKAMAFAALAASQNKAPRSVEPVNDKPKSKTRLEFEAYLQGITERWEGITLPAPTLHQTQPGKPCFAASATVSNEPEIPLHQLLKDLMLKATKK